MLSRTLCSRTRPRTKTRTWNREQNQGQELGIKAAQVYRATSRRMSGENSDSGMYRRKQANRKNRKWFRLMIHRRPPIVERDNPFSVQPSVLMKNQEEESLSRMYSNTTDGFGKYATHKYQIFVLAAICNCVFLAGK